MLILYVIQDSVDVVVSVESSYYRYKQYDEHILSSNDSTELHLELPFVNSTLVYPMYTHTHWVCAEFNLLTFQLKAYWNSFPQNW